MAPFPQEFSVLSQTYFFVPTSSVGTKLVTLLHHGTQERSRKLYNRFYKAE